MKRETQLYVIIFILAVLLASIGGYAVGATYQFNLSQSKTPSSILLESENQNNTEKRTLVVTGVGSVSVEPTMAKVNLGVLSEASTAAMAVQWNADNMTNVIEALVSMGLSKEDMETQHYELYPIMDYESKTPRIVGYRARNVIVVKIYNLNMTGQAIDVAVESGANEVQGVTFTLTESESQRLKLEALRRAAEDAKTKASTIASALGVAILGIFQVTESSVYHQPYQLSGAYNDVSKTQILPGDVQISATVQVTYLVQ